ncbi:MAG: primosomal protein N', partial [Corynebacterium humireducens]|nr:primosomal protein N' [Corynebacterium humireducens]
MASPRVPAEHLPVARVLPLLGLAHLDRPFDYQVPSTLDDDARPGVRVRIRFAGRLVDAVLLERRAHSEHEGRLSWIERVISPNVVYPPRTARLIDALADRYAGNRSDLIRAALPTRHARAEEADVSTPWEDLGEVSEPDLSAWASYEFGMSFVDAVLAGQTARAAWQVAPGDSWAEALAALAVKVVLDGGGALVVVPDQRDVVTLEAALRELVGAKQITVLTAAQGPQARYRRFLSVLAGQGRLVIGTRSAAFAPVHDLRLAVVLHDGDDNLVDPRAPYVHAREVLTTRSAQEGCSLILAGHTRTAEAQLLVESGWAHDLVATRDTVRRRSPLIRATADSDFELERDPLAASARLPKRAFEALRGALDRGEPALVQVPRKGYVPTLACGSCR